MFYYSLAFCAGLVLGALVSLTYLKKDLRKEIDTKYTRQIEDLKKLYDDTLTDNSLLKDSNNMLQLKLNQLQALNN